MAGVVGRKWAKKPVFVGLRLDKSAAEGVERIMKRQGVSRSEAIRLAIELMVNLDRLREQASNTS